MKIPAPRLWRMICLPAILIFAGCHSSTPSSHDNDQSLHTFAAHGVIEKIAPDGRQVTIHHETIPGYMIEMTMDFPVDDPAELRNLVPGDKVDFTLNVTQDRDWVSHLQRTGHTQPAMADAMSMDDGQSAQLKPGDEVPDGELITEHGSRIHLSDFRGQVVALTFFFTRCPLPAYCPLMNRNFARARELLLANPGAPKNWEFLSISFDPDFDQPATLTSYGGFYRQNNADRWLFAAAPSPTLARLAPAIGLVVVRQGPSLSHNVRTLVIDPKGRLFRQFNDNLWTPKQLADAIVKATRPAD